MDVLVEQLILAALQKLSTVSKEVEVRRKFKKKTNNTIQWWFLIRGDESVLKLLEQEWEGVQERTSWKLELCHRLATQSNGEQASSETTGHDANSFLPRK